MKVTLKLSSTGGIRRCRVPYPHASHVVSDGSCPLCGAIPFSVQGAGKRPSADDQSWEATAVAACCGRQVGLLRAEMDTIFGVAEDERVLAGPWRVY